MKKAVKTLSLVALCVVMIIMAVVPAFANTVYVENHNVIDCTNRYKEGNSEFHFTIKIPKELSLSDVTIAITKNSSGDILFEEPLSYFSSQITYSYSDGNSNYYEFVTGKYSDAGVGIKLFCEYNGNYYMATDNGFGQTAQGHGYWLAA